MKRTLGRLGAIVLFAATGCSSSLPSASAPGDSAPMPAEQLPAPDAPAIPGAPLTPGGVLDGNAGGLGAKEPAANVDKAPANQMLIHNGTLGLRVDAEAFGETLDKVADTATELDGYISSQDDRSITVRVPSTVFRKAMRAMEKLGDVSHRGVKAEDVTEQFHDLGIRLKSLQATRDRLQGFLAAAKNIDEVLRVEQELARIAGEIDKIEGRMRFLQSQTAFSTITVALEARPKASVIVDPSKPPPPPPARTVALPIEWLAGVGLEDLFTFDD